MQETFEDSNFEIPRRSMAPDPMPGIQVVDEDDHIPLPIPVNVRNAANIQKLTEKLVVMELAEMTAANTKNTFLRPNLSDRTLVINNDKSQPPKNIDRDRLLYTALSQTRSN